MPRAVIVRTAFTLDSPYTFEKRFVTGSVHKMATDTLQESLTVTLSNPGTSSDPRRSGPSTSDVATNEVAKKASPPRLTLDTMRAGQKAVVKSVSVANRALCGKLLAMGIVTGTAVEVLRIAPLGDPIKIEALGYKLALRMSEAQNVEVEALA